MKSNSLKKQLSHQFYKKNIPALSLAVFAAIVSAALNLIVSWLMQQIIDAASGIPGALPINDLLIISIGFVFLCLVAYLMDYVSQPIYIGRAMRQYKEYAFQKLIEKNISSFNEYNTATYLSAFTNDAVNIETDYIAQLLSLITKTVMFFGALIMMLFYSPLLTLIAIAITTLPFFASLLTGNRLQNVEKRISDRNKDFTSTLEDCLSGFSVIKSFKAEKEIFNLYKESNNALENEKFSKRRIKILVGMIGSVTGIFAQLGVFIVGAYLSLTGYGITPGVVIVFVNLMNFIIDPISQLPGLLASRKAALALIDKLASVMEQKTSNGEGERVSSLEHEIVLDNVSFSYESGKEILHGVSLEFEAGKSYAIVGGSGSGKSTLLNLLLSGSTGYRGSIKIDGKELRNISTESLYDMISVIQQNVFVFNASIRDNISMFRSFPEKDIDDVINRAHLSELVKERGEDYLCGEGGKGLSGGEKQRISIARSLLKNSSILLADEVTSALDQKTAYQVSNDILDLNGITRIVVTHSLDESILRRYDEIVVLKEGRIVETGVFDKLMENKGYFYALYTVSQ
ncbi:MAG: ABC transporter ATP-binding protein [Candidatus Ornithospirochaeta sp.]